MQISGRKSGSIAALDLGEVRTGVAISDPGATLARPLEVVASEHLEDYLQGMLVDEGVEEVIVGVPLTMEGETGMQARRALKKIEALKTAFPEVRFIEKDERLTTKMAASGPKPGKKGGKNRQRVDHLAAARMLQEHLDYRGKP